MALTSKDVYVVTEDGLVRTGYRYHVFLSYARAEGVAEWTRNHFHPVLRQHLDAELPEKPQIFIDENIESGDEWPEALKHALQRSRCVVSIWSQQYFRSKWCLAEWKTIQEREKVLGYRSTQNTHGLVVPIMLSDPKDWPDAAQRTQCRHDLTDYKYPFIQFRDSQRYLEFYDRMRSVVTDIKMMLNHAPPWDERWPFVSPALEPRKPFSFEHL
jgi:hypothetical protein